MRRSFYFRRFCVIICRLWWSAGGRVKWLKVIGERLESSEMSDGSKDRAVLLKKDNLCHKCPLRCMSLNENLVYRKNYTKFAESLCML